MSNNNNIQPAAQPHVEEHSMIEIPNEQHDTNNDHDHHTSSTVSIHDERSNTSRSMEQLVRRKSIHRSHKDIAKSAADEDDEHPLLDAELVPKVKPPLAHPESEDDSNDDGINTTHDHPGVDDGFFGGNGAGPTDGSGGHDTTDSHDKPNNHDHNDDDDDHHHLHPHNGVIPRRKPSFPLPPDYDGGSVMYDAEGNPTVIPDVNVYQHKKTLAQGMMDLALLSANANQLRYVLESRNRHPYYYLSLTFISLSLILQVAVGIGLILNSKYNVKRDDHICKADKVNNLTVLGVFLVTIVNVFITSFGVADVGPPI